MLYKTAVILMRKLAVYDPKTYKPVKATNMEQVIDNILWAEGSGANQYGDNGAAHGWGQFHKPAWIDATQHLGVQKDPAWAYGTGTKDLSKVRRAIQAYLERYVTEKRLGRKPTNEDYYRFYNRGFKGLNDASVKVAPRYQTLLGLGTAPATQKQQKAVQSTQQPVKQVSLSQQPPAPQKQRKTYTIKSGDTLWGLRNTLFPGKSWQAQQGMFTKFNPGVDMNKLRVGQSIYIE